MTGNKKWNQENTLPILQTYIDNLAARDPKADPYKQANYIVWQARQDALAAPIVTTIAYIFGTFKLAIAAAKNVISEAELLDFGTKAIQQREFKWTKHNVSLALQRYMGEIDPQRDKFKAASYEAWRAGEASRVTPTTAVIKKLFGSFQNAVLAAEEMNQVVGMPRPPSQKAVQLRA